MNPGVFLRAKAASIDGCILIVIMFLSSYISALLPSASNAMRIVPFVGFALLYDPLMTAIKGQTIGHMAMGIKVVSYSDPSKCISFLSAMLRFILKTTLGWLSLLTVGSNKDSRAIHDLACNSRVIYA